MKSPHREPAAVTPGGFVGSFAPLACGRIVTDADGCVRYADAVLQQRTGTDATEVLGRPLGDLWEEPGAATLRGAVAAAEPFAGRLRWRRTGASGIDCDVELRPIRNGAGRLQAFVAEVRDVVGAQTIERQILQAQRVQTMGQFASALAHDFNNLLTVLSGHIGLIEGSGEATPSIRVALAEMSQALQRATALTRQLLVSAARQEPHFRWVDLNDAVGQVSGLVRRVVGPAVVVRVHPAPAPAWVRADPGMLDQVLMNLCLNARDAMPHGGRLDLLVERIRGAAAEVVPGIGAETTEYVRLTVADTGCGIAPELHGRVFEPFFTTRGERGGSGLGLATVATIVRQHDGVCGLESTAGHGTRFFLWLPAVAAPAAGADLRPPRAVAGGERVLVVEGEGDPSAAVGPMLAAAGYRVTQVDSSATALELCREARQPIDLLIADEPANDAAGGRGLACELAARPPGPPQAIVLERPFSRADLLQVVRRALDAAGRHRESI